MSIPKEIIEYIANERIVEKLINKLFVGKRIHQSLVDDLAQEVYFELLKSKQTYAIENAYETDRLYNLCYGFIKTIIQSKDNRFNKELVSFHKKRTDENYNGPRYVEE